ncbi:hypothetical protein DFH08DRAFT_1046019 [Mycena albidolilacea]|uniref:Ion transport domain-containing protein n=1 Tax=Mycena albidolilacea TaxID=1033008 RepID=A0AAD6Z747_9AGAR|nr:hypothetical protein DFH08DRAFT_1046019 [Mycena albidolilacea]
MTVAAIGMSFRQNQFTHQLTLTYPSLAVEIAFRRTPTPPSHSGDRLFFCAPVAVYSVGPDAMSHHVRRHRRAALPSAASLRPILRKSMTAPRLLSPFSRRACVPAPRALRYIPRLLHLAALPPPPTQPPPLHDFPSVVNAATITTATLRSDLRQHRDHSHRRVLRYSPLVPLASTDLPHGIPMSLITRQTNILGSWGNRSISWPFCEVFSSSPLSFVACDSQKPQCPLVSVFIVPNLQFGLQGVCPRCVRALSVISFFWRVTGSAGANRPTSLFLWHPDPSRPSGPRYQNMFHIVVWLFFFLVYSQAVRQPLERSTQQPEFDEWEVVMYTMALALLCEDINRVIAFITDGILTAAFLLRIAGLSGAEDKAANLRLMSFQILSFVAPLLWMTLLTVFGGYKYVGTGLLSILSLGFGQGLYAFDASDGSKDRPSSVRPSSPDYDRFNQSPAGLMLYYLWGAITCLILLNILISLFSSVYQNVVDDAEAQYLAFFASKTVGMMTRMCTPRRSTYLLTDLHGAAGA